VRFAITQKSVKIPLFKKQKRTKKGIDPTCIILGDLNTHKPTCHILNWAVGSIDTPSKKKCVLPTAQDKEKKRKRGKGFSLCEGKGGRYDDKLGHVTNYNARDSIVHYLVRFL